MLVDAEEQNHIVFKSQDSSMVTPGCVEAVLISEDYNFVSAQLRKV